MRRPRAVKGEVGTMDTILEMKGITKRFPGVLALDHVDFSVGKGEQVNPDEDSRWRDRA